MTFESDWQPALGEPLKNALATESSEGRLEIGRVAAHGYFSLESSGAYQFAEKCKPATAFLFKLIAMLQFPTRHALEAALAGPRFKQSLGNAPAGAGEVEAMIVTYEYHSHTCSRAPAASRLGA